MALDMRTTNGSSQFPLHTIFTPKTFLLTWYHYGFPQSSPLEFVHMQLCFWVHFYFLEDKTRWNGRGEHIGSRKQSFFSFRLLQRACIVWLLWECQRATGKFSRGRFQLLPFYLLDKPWVYSTHLRQFLSLNIMVELPKILRQSIGRSEDSLQSSQRILIQEILNFLEIFWFQPGLRVGAKKRGRLQCFDINQLEKYLLRGCNVVLWCVWGVRNNV